MYMEEDADSVSRRDIGSRTTNSTKYTLWSMALKQEIVAKNVPISRLERLTSSFREHRAMNTSDALYH